MNKRRNFLAGLLGWAGLSAAAKAESTEKPDLVIDSGLQIFFVQNDTVIAFNGNTGDGTQVGNVIGAIGGTSITNFQFIPKSQTTITFNNRALITDTDGDQILFQVLGSGSFIAPLTDTTTPLGTLMSLGGPLVATYIAIQGSGKYAFLVGREFPVKMAATNSAIGSAGVLGNVYVEVYSDSVGALSTAIRSYRR
jgi:hypothetical protein